MTQIKDTERELQLFRLRLSVAGLVVFVCFGLLMLRFLFVSFVLQLVIWQVSRLCFYMFMFFF
jgi:hypothetical protein